MLNPDLCAVKLGSSENAGESDVGGEENTCSGLELGGEEEIWLIEKSIVVISELQDVLDEDGESLTIE